MSDNSVSRAYDAAKNVYAALGVDTDEVLRQVARVPISLHCWQGDDVCGFESAGDISEGGIMATGNYPGKATTPDELRADLEQAYRLIPGKHRLNLHASYGEMGGQKVDRNAIEFRHYEGWTQWAAEQGIGMDFNPTCFAHPNAADGFTLAHADPAIRQFWIEHCIACREIGAAIGEALQNPCVTNVWVPDGFKDLPADRLAPRQRLESALDEVFAAKVDRKWNLDAVECKLFGIGSEAYVVGSHEFYLGYAVKNGLVLCLDAGHFHPTEVISDKLSSVLLHVDEVLLHVSRGVRWDSDHVVLLTDELRNIAEELVRGDLLSRVHVGLDFFDASINRIAAWVIGTRAMIKALLLAYLEPRAALTDFEQEGDYTSRLALLEECKTLPFGAVWDRYCEEQDVPRGMDWMRAVREYESKVLLKR